MSRSLLRALARASLCVVFLHARLPFGAVAQEFAPDDPRVRVLVDEGVAFLEDALFNVADPAEKALAGYAVLKSQLCYRAEGIDREHPIVREAWQAIVAEGPGEHRNSTYALSVKLLFLCAHDATGNRQFIEVLLAELLARQKPHGGWGYSASALGDTSMTQFALVALWELERHGFATPGDAWERAVGWLLRTQDPSGGFGYQGLEMEDGRLVPQNEVRESLTAGAAGGLYIALDHIGGGSRPDAAREGPPREPPPPEVQPKDPPPPEGDGSALDVDRAALDRALAAANAWLENTGKFPPQRHLYYYLYALERYRTFRDKAEGRAAGDEHAGGPWYDAGVRLLAVQAGNPHRGWRGETSPAVDTSFAILFLVRSSLLSQGDPLLGGGELGSGHDLATLLPPDEREAELLDILRDPAALPEVVQDAADDESPRVRAAALRALARTRDLKHVPALLRALADPEAAVAETAHDGLRFVSRRLSGMPADLPPPGAERDAVLAAWREWHAAIRPQADLD